MPHDFRDDEVLTDDQVEALLDDVELRARADVAAARELNARQRRSDLEIRPGNAAERRGSVEVAEVVELHGQWASCRAEAPITVGNVFHLTFDRSWLDTDPVLAVCDRCAMLGEASFEARFRFLRDVVPQEET